MKRFLALALAFACLGVFPVAAHAADARATLTIRYHVCPHGFARAVYPQICGNHPANLTVHIDGVSLDWHASQANEDGVNVFSLPPGVYAIQRPPNDYTRDFELVCQGSANAADASSLRVSLAAGAGLTCDLYYVGDSSQAEYPYVQDDHLFDQKVFAIACETDPGLVGNPGDADFPPARCQPEAGVTLTATRGDAHPLGSCVTAADGVCTLSVPAGQVILSEVPDAAPAGYAPVANPVLLRATHAPPGMVNVRALRKPAPGTAALTIHSRVCPPLYAGTEYFNDCHGAAPSYAQTIFLIGENGGPDATSARIDGAGNVTFSGLAAESYTFVPGMPTLTATTSVACARAASPAGAFPSATIVVGSASKTTLTLAAGDEVVCDLYAIPRKD